jgi:hypothetical protein
MLFYERLVPLNRDAHATLKVRGGGFGYAARTNSSPLLAAEMVDAARCYPILFVDIGQSQVFPIALLGLRVAENLFVVPGGGGWEEGAYVPAFVRRYPFVLTSDMTVCIDEAFAGFDRDEGEPLFDESGGNAPALEQAVTFLRGFHDEAERTRALVAELQERALLKPVSLNVAPADGSDAYRIDGLQTIDEEALAALSGEAVMSLFRSGALAAVYAPQVSLKGLDELNRRTGARATATPAQTEAEAGGQVSGAVATLVEG